MFDVAIINVEPSIKVDKLLSKFPFAKLFDTKITQLETIKHIVNTARTEYVWILSNDINYDNFNFNFKPLRDKSELIFAWLNDYYFFNTFLIPVNTFKKHYSIENLEHYPGIEYSTSPVLTHIKPSNNSPLDVFFVSNGEPYALKHYNILQSLVNRPVTWIKDINDRSQAFKAAAKKSKTEWFFSIPAKLQVADDFNWDWVPMDRYYSGPKKHFVFNATNPVNQLVYGHMALVAYNRTLVLDTIDPGIDFTLSKPYQTIPINSGTGYFNLDPLTTWRTAFRETLKLSYYYKISPTTETEQRLNTWSTTAQGVNANWCLQGAKDALQYFESINGNYDEIIKSYHWQWVDSYAQQKGYNL